MGGENRGALGEDNHQSWREMQRGSKETLRQVWGCTEFQPGSLRIYFTYE